MPRNGSGVYSPPSLPGSFNPAVSGQQGTPADFNTLTADLSAGLTQSVSADGQTTITANQALSGFKHTGVGNAAARTDYAAAGQITDAVITYALDTGAADACAIAPTIAADAYRVGQSFQFKVLNANLTTTPTLAVSGLATPGVIKWPDGSALAAGDLPASALVEVIVASIGPAVFHLQTVALPGIRAGLLTTRGDIITRGATAPQRTALGTNGQVLTSNATDAVWATPTVVRGSLAGLTLSAPGGTGTFGIAAGQAVDSTNVAYMALASAYTKTTGAWALGTAAGSLDTGAIANSTWYHVYLISRSDTGVVDVLVSLSASAPTMPTSYDRKRRIGSLLTDGSAQWVKFLQDGDYFRWDAMVADAADTNPGTSALLKTLTVPTGVNVMANVAVSGQTGSTNFDGYIADPAVSDEVPAWATGKTNFGGVGSSRFAIAAVLIRTNTSAQVRYRISSSGASDIVRIATLGWNDRRGRDT